MAGQTSNTKFKPGQSGNPKGRPKAEWTWSGVLRQAMEKAVGPKQIKELVSEALMEKALTGDVQAIKEIGNRIDGMPKQSVDHTTDGEKLGGVAFIKEE